MKRTSCQLGAPISANQMYVPIARGKMVKSKKYNEWIDKVVPQIKANLDPAEHFPVVVDILIMGGRDFPNERDIDNVAKPVVDALVRADILPDDRIEYVEDVHPHYLPGSRKSDALMIIRIEEPEQPTSEWGKPD